MSRCQSNKVFIFSVCLFCVVAAVASSGVLGRDPTPNEFLLAVGDNSSAIRAEGLGQNALGSITARALQDPKPCDSRRPKCSQICVESSKGPQCRCNVGFVLAGDSTECLDVDECSDQNRCQHSCTNFPGSYKCSCHPGSVLDADGYSCNCEEGFAPTTLSGHAQSRCMDIDECSFPIDPCTARSRNAEKSSASEPGPVSPLCVNKPGSFECQCPDGCVCASGFERQGNLCVDVNECTRPALNGCPATDGVYCVNTMGSYHCECQHGFRPSAVERWTPGDTGAVIVCVDIDECVETPKCDHGCRNTKGSYECECQHGFTTSPLDRHECVDLDECAEKRHNCGDHACRNTEGSYECDCLSGYVRDRNNKTKCIDVDECKQGPNECTAGCINTPGSYECECPQGYASNPASKAQCIDIDECAKKPPICEHSCRNTVGSYECDCPTGFTNDPNDKNKCVDKCSLPSSPCYSVHVSGSDRLFGCYCFCSIKVLAFVFCFHFFL